MRNHELAKREAAIRALIHDTGVATAGDLELQSHWAKYLCVLVAGYTESALHLLYASYVDKCTPVPVAKFATQKIKELQNPRPNRFVEVARAFKEDWGAKLEEFIALDGRHEAINAIMTARHLIAHGKSSDISVHRVSEYFDKSVKVAEFIESQLS
jgi:hypothetical protein